VVLLGSGPDGPGRLTVAVGLATFLRAIRAAGGELAWTLGSGAVGAPALVLEDPTAL
jgi:hypothetical protein